MPSNRARRRAEQQARRRTQRRVMAGAAGLAVLTAAGWGFDTWNDRPRPRPLPEDVREGAERIGDQGDLTIGTVPDSYRIVYRVDEYAGGDHTVTTDDYRVERPFTGRIDRYEDEPPGDELSSAQIVTFGRMTIPGVRGAKTAALIIPPDIAPSDVRFEDVLPHAVERGLVEAREWRRVMGRECQVFRAGGPAAAGDLVEYREDIEEYADLCVDEQGFMLEEVWVTDGRVLRRRLAVELDTGISIDKDLLEHDGTPLDPDDGGGSVNEVDPESNPLEDSYRATYVPDGFELEGRYAVVPTQPQSDDPESDRNRRMASVVDVWVRGPDLVLLDQGGTLGAVQAFQPEPIAERVEVAPFGEADLILSFHLNEVRILLERGRFIRVRGTVDPDELLRIARGLQRVENGAGLVYLEPPRSGEDTADLQDRPVP